MAVKKKKKSLNCFIATITKLVFNNTDFFAVGEHFLVIHQTMIPTKVVVFLGCKCGKEAVKKGNNEAIL